MTYINTESGICLSSSGEVLQSPPVFSCECPCAVDAVGKNSIDITNTCTLPIAITGFKNSDPSRFTLFKYPEYTGVETYSTGNGVVELPINLEPFQATRIQTFFHPTTGDIAHGTEGTFDDRRGDSFNSHVTIHPGFPILNCEDSEGSCDAYFTLSGELICNSLKDGGKGWLPDKDNFIEPTATTPFPIPTAKYCIPSTGVFNWPVPDGWMQNPIPAAFSGLREAAGRAQQFLDTQPDYKDPVSFPLVPRAGWSGALKTFEYLISKLQITGIGFTGDRDFNSIVTGMSGSWTPNVVLVSNLPVEVLGVVPIKGTREEQKLLVSGGYRGNNAYACEYYTGINIDIKTSDTNRAKGVVITNSTVWFGHDAKALPPTVSLLISNSGDFLTDELCGNLRDDFSSNVLKAMLDGIPKEVPNPAREYAKAHPEEMEEKPCRGPEVGPDGYWVRNYPAKEYEPHGKCDPGFWRL